MISKLSEKAFYPILKWIFKSANSRTLDKKLFEGQTIIDGLTDNVTIYRDSWHVPHIYSNSNEDMFFAQGWVHAQDRLWQMEINRRIGMGTLAEAFGKDALDTDRLTRTLGFKHLALKDYSNMSHQFRSYLKSYVDGLNAYLETAKFPIEFKLSGISPKKWTPVDCLSWSRVMIWTLSHGWSHQFTYQKIYDLVGQDMFSELDIFYPSENPIEIQSITKDPMDNIDTIYDAAKGPYLFKDMEGGGRGSNAWALSGERTKTNYLVSMIAEDLIGDKSSKKGADKLYEHLANKTDTGKFAWQNDDCKIKSGNPYKGTDIAIDNKFEKWDFRLSKDRVKCRPKAKGSTKTNDIKLLKVYEICKRGVKEDGKTRANCDYRNEYVWDKTYIGRMEVKMPTSGGKNKFKSKYLYFQMN